MQKAPRNVATAQSAHTGRLSPEQLTVLLVAPQDPNATGGQARFGFLLAESLRDSPQIDLKTITVPEQDRVGQRTLRSLAVMRGIRRKAKSHRGLVVHIFSPCNRVGLLEKLVWAWVARVSGGRSILNLRNALDVFADTWSRLERSLWRALLSSNDLILCQYQGLADALVDKQILRPTTSTAVVPNGILNLSEPRGCSVPACDEFTLLFLGSVCTRKGVDRLLEAASILDGRNDLSVAWTLVLAGPLYVRRGESDPRAMVDELGLGHRIRLVGPVRGQAKAELLQRADVLLLPSRAEGFPNSVLEAMASGLPVIVSDVGAMPEMVRDSGGGVVVPNGDPSGIAEAVSRMMYDRDYRRRLGESGRKRVATSYRLDMVVDLFVNVYRRVAGDPTIVNQADGRT